MRIAIAAMAAVGAAGLATPAAAYRPFDGTDAAVADLGEVELELQPAGIVRARTPATVSDAVFNYGFADRWELVLQATVQTLPEAAGPISVPDGAFLKYVVQPGALQNKPGPSIATEFGVLLPTGDGTNPGLSWAGIVSQRWEWGTVHLNVETNVTPDRHGEFFFDAIVEGPIQWTVRPVFEIYSDSVVNQSQTFSALVGAIWQARDNLAFDAGLRCAFVNGRLVNEIRAGLTVGFSPLSLSQPIGAQFATPGRL